MSAVEVTQKHSAASVTTVSQNLTNSKKVENIRCIWYCFDMSNINYYYSMADDVRYFKGIVSQLIVHLN